MAVCLVRSECIPKGQKPCLYRFPDASYTLLQKIADRHPQGEAPRDDARDGAATANSATHNATDSQRLAMLFE